MGKKSARKMTGLTLEERIKRSLEKDKKFKELTEAIKEKLKDKQAQIQLIEALKASKSGAKITEEQLEKIIGEMKGESAKT